MTPSMKKSREFVCRNLLADLSSPFGREGEYATKRDLYIDARLVYVAEFCDATGPWTDAQKYMAVHCKCPRPTTEERSRYKWTCGKGPYPGKPGRPARETMADWCKLPPDLYMMLGRCQWGDGNTCLMFGYYDTMLAAEKALANAMIMHAKFLKAYGHGKKTPLKALPKFVHPIGLTMDYEELVK